MAYTISMPLRKFNNLLSVIVVLLGLYISLNPLLPQIAYWLRDKSPEHTAPYSGELAKEVGSKATNTLPADNRLVIPSIGINEPINEGKFINVIKDGGTWRRPNGTTPDKDGNTIIVGHRFYGKNTSTFYNLDKVIAGQKLAVYWEGKEIMYEVREVKIVDATAIEIESPTDEKQLTLYTCHPIWTAKQRLVLIAKPVQPEIDGI
jgi:sortase A